MPTYTIHDTKKDEYFDTICTWGELEEFLDNNPHCRKVITAPAIVSGVQGRSFKTDGGFNEVMSKISEAHPASPLADRYGSNESHKTKQARKAVRKDVQKMFPGNKDGLNK